MFRFEDLKITTLDTGEKYHYLLLVFEHEIEQTRRVCSESLFSVVLVCSVRETRVVPLQIYEKHRQDPPLARGMPPVCGKIAWARQLSRRMEKPMLIFFVSSYCPRFMTLFVSVFWCSGLANSDGAARSASSRHEIQQSSGSAGRVRDSVSQCVETRHRCGCRE